jgi:benzil reductase ((S)-benzoin forming)
MSKKIAIVTGASRGFGAACVDLLLERGYKVIALARSEIKETEQLITIKCDISNLSELETKFKAVTDKISASTVEDIVLINNAATLHPVGALGTSSIQNLDNCFRLNITAPIWISGEVIRSNPSAKIRIVDLSSGAAYNAYSGWTAYCASKAALRMAAMSIAEDLKEFSNLKDRNIGILEYAPGVLDTDMQQEVRNSGKDNFPHIDKFIEMKDEGQLVPAIDSAKAIMGFIESDKVKLYEEMRYS